MGDPFPHGCDPGSPAHLSQNAAAVIQSGPAKMEPEPVCTSKCIPLLQEWPLGVPVAWPCRQKKGVGGLELEPALATV